MENEKNKIAIDGQSKKARKSPVVVAVLPGAGLGNILFIWAKALIFARMNGLPYYTLGWHRWRIGPWLRAERSKRSYGSFFKENASFLKRHLVKLQIAATAAPRQSTNPVAAIWEDTLLNKYDFVVYDQIPGWSDFFEGIKEHRQLVKEELYAMLQPSLRSLLDRSHAPVIGVHIRLGDFRRLQANENFRKTGGVRTPQEYFRQMINRIRELKNEILPVMIFTDGHASEIAEILNLPNVSLAPANPDIIDLLLLSRSKLIITSAGSTFGYWAGFLSDAPVIMHPDHIHASLRAPEFNHRYYEGALLDNPSPILIENIRQIESPQNSRVRPPLEMGDGSKPAP